MFWIRPVRQKWVTTLLGIAFGSTSLVPFGFTADAADAITSDQVAADDVALFETQIKPLLQAKCYKCHGDGKQKGGLSLASRAGLLRGGDLGPAVDLDELDDSQLMRALRYEDVEMPPDGRLSDDQIELFAKWISKGIPWTPSDDGSDLEEIASSTDAEPAISDEDRNYWAYRPVVRPALPAVSNPSWLVNEIDAFILARLDDAALAPAPAAGRRTLIRRLSYDLTGLPPTESEVSRFLADDRPDAYERLVDRILNSPHYGEKWGRHWLDVVHYAETNGYERDGPKPNVWRYRDYVIDAFNEDKPYDAFILEQLAGDEIDDATAEQWIATGVQRLGLWDDEPADPVQAYYDSLDDVVSTTCQIYLGMSVGCARCHDHKIDPIPQSDYYRLMAFFNNTYKDIREDVYEKTKFTYLTQTTIASEAEKRAHRELEKAHRQQLDRLRAQVKVYEDEVYESFSNPEKEDAADDRTRREMIRKKAADVLGHRELAEYRRLKKEFDRQEQNRIPQLARALTVRENGGEAPPMHIHIRGSAHAKGKEVRPGFPSVLTDVDPDAPPRPGKASSGRRTLLAQWIASRQNPLTARVMVNRLWQHHFGRGIVSTSNDFGRFGQQPTHPALLDWLAAEFMENDWQIKAMQRRIVTSSAYRMAYYESEIGHAKDPENRLFWRFDMRRLTAEEVRDSVLLLTGRFNEKMGGPSVYTEIPKELLHGASRPDHAWGTSPPSERVRRSIYVHIKRSVVEPVLGTFDIADTDASCPVRFVTTVSTQALTSLNGEFFNREAAVMADRVRHEAGSNVADQVAYGLHLALHRPPSESEIERGVGLIHDWQSKDNLTAEKALDYFCLMVLNLNELLYLD